MTARTAAAIGRLGEDLALGFFMACGYECLARRYRRGRRRGRPHRRAAAAGGLRRGEDPGTGQLDAGARVRHGGAVAAPARRGARLARRAARAACAPTCAATSWRCSSGARAAASSCGTSPGSADPSREVVGEARTCRRALSCARLAKRAGSVVALALCSPPGDRDRPFHGRPPTAGEQEATWRHELLAHPRGGPRGARRGPLPGRRRAVRSGDRGPRAVASSRLLHGNQRRPHAPARRRPAAPRAARGARPGAGSAPSRRCGATSRGRPRPPSRARGAPPTCAPRTTPKRTSRCSRPDSTSSSPAASRRANRRPPCRS